MPYNAGMTQITLVLPFALPPPALAPDLVRALQAPALAALLTRSSLRAPAARRHAARTAARSLAGARAGLSPDGEPAFAAAAMRGWDSIRRADSWFIINPAHIEIARSHLSMADTRPTAASTTAHSRALFDTARPCSTTIGKTLVYGDAHDLVHARRRLAGADTASPDAAVGHEPDRLAAGGAPAAEFRKLQNEVQMLWFEHPANVEREARGLPAVNSFWPWGAAAPGSAVRRRRRCRRPGGSPAGWPHWPAPGSLAAQPVQRPGRRQHPGRAANCAEPAIAADWAAGSRACSASRKPCLRRRWRHCKQARAGTLTLVLSHRSAIKEFTTTKLAQRAFWRSPTLDRLLP